MCVFQRLLIGTEALGRGWKWFVPGLPQYQSDLRIPRNSSTWSWL